MKKAYALVFTLIALLTFGTHKASAQGASDYGSGLKVNLNEDGSKYVRFITWHQVWAQYNDKAGTSDNPVDMRLRRSRFLAFAQINKDFLIVTHFGVNNQSTSSGGVNDASAPGKKPQLYMHDAWVEYSVVKKTEENPFSLDFGAGLHYWNGISRITMASTLNFLEIDAPTFNWPNIETTDQFARQMGYYIKGKYDMVGYSFSINEPFKQNAPAIKKDGPALLNDKTTKWAYNGYVELQLADQEGNLLPYKVGTYVGTKTIFNVGAGFYFHPDGSVRLDADSSRVNENHLILSADVFFDQPIGGDMALTAYGVFYSMDYGKDYVRSGGTIMGTGSIFFAQAGLLLPKDILGDLGRLQPFVGFSYKDFDAYDSAGIQYDLGFNWFIDGHNAKISAQYSSVPQLTGSKDDFGVNKAQVTIQTQIYL